MSYYSTVRNDHSIITSLLLFGILAGGCHNALTPDSNSTINGAVALIDTAGNFVAGLSGIQVAVDGGSQSTLTDSMGHFTLENVPDGNIPLIFFKPGFAEFHDHCTVSAASHSATYGTASLFQISRISSNIVLRPFGECFVRYNFRDTQVFSHAAGIYIHSWLYDSLYEQYGLTQFSCRIMDAPNHLGRFGASVQIYFSDQDSISPAGVNSYRFATQQQTVDVNDGSVSFDIYRDSLLKHGFVSNSTIYCTAFANGYYTQEIFYTDKASGKEIFTGFSPLHSEIRSFVLP